jgi:hypothetical protein
VSDDDTGIVIFSSIEKDFAEFEEGLGGLVGGGLLGGLFRLRGGRLLGRRSERQQPDSRPKSKTDRTLVSLTWITGGS